MEEVKRLISTLGEEGVLKATPHTEALLLLFLELSDGHNLKIVSKPLEECSSVVMVLLLVARL